MTTPLMDAMTGAASTAGPTDVGTPREPDAPPAASWDADGYELWRRAWQVVPGGPCRLVRMTAVTDPEGRPGGIRFRAWRFEGSDPRRSPDLAPLGPAADIRPEEVLALADTLGRLIDAARGVLLPMEGGEPHAHAPHHNPAHDSGSRTP